MRRQATIIIILLAALPGVAFSVPTSPVNYFRAPLPGTDLAREPVLAGTVVEDRIIPYSTPPGWSAPSSGTVQVRAVRGADGRLSYYWRIKADPSSRDQVQGLDIQDFPLTAYDANWRRDGLGSIAPDMVGVFNRVGTWEIYFEFTYPNAIHAGEESRFFFLRTSARASRPARIRVRFGNTWSAYLPASAPAS
jgi:hypothetical protein